MRIAFHLVGFICQTIVLLQATGNELFIAQDSVQKILVCCLTISRLKKLAYLLELVYPWQDIPMQILGHEFGKRGSQDNGLIQESYWNLIVGLSLNDIWFIKRKFN